MLAVAQAQATEQATEQAMMQAKLRETEMEQIMGAVTKRRPIRPHRRRQPHPGHRTILSQPPLLPLRHPQMTTVGWVA